MIRSLRALVPLAFALSCALSGVSFLARPAGAQSPPPAPYDPMADPRPDPSLVLFTDLGAEKAKGEDLYAGGWERTNTGTPAWSNFADAPGWFTGGLTCAAGTFNTGRWFAAGLFPRRDVTLGVWLQATTDWSAWTANGVFQLGSAGLYSDFIRLRRNSATQFQIQYSRIVSGGPSLTTAIYNFPAGAGPPLAGEWRKFDILITAAGTITPYVNGLPAVQTNTPAANFGQAAPAGACFEGGATVLYDTVSGVRNPCAVVSDFTALAGCHVPGQPAPPLKPNRLTVVPSDTPAGVALRATHLGFLGQQGKWLSQSATRALTAGLGLTRRDKILLASPMDLAPFAGSVPGPTPGSPWQWDTRVLERTMAYAAAEAYYIHIDVDGVPNRLQDPAGARTPYYAGTQLADPLALSNGAVFQASVPNDGTNTGTLATGDAEISDSSAETWAYAACDEVLLIRAWCVANGVDPSRVTFGFWNEGNTPSFWRTGAGYKDPKSALYKLWQHWVVKMRTLDPSFQAETLSTTGTDRAWIGDFLRRAKADGLSGAVSAVQVHDYSGLPSEFPAAAARAVAAECDAAGVPHVPIFFGEDSRTTSFPGSSAQYPRLSPHYDFNANAVGAAYLGAVLIACARSVERTGVPITGYTFVANVAYNDLDANANVSPFGSTGLLTPDLTRLATANVYDLMSRCTLDTDPANQPRHAVTQWEGARQVESLATVWGTGNLVRVIVAVPGAEPDRELAIRLQLPGAFAGWSAHVYRVDDEHASPRDGANGALVGEDAGLLDATGGTDLTVRGASVSLVELSAVNHPPVANAQSVTTAEDTAKAITLTASDPDGDPLTYTVVSGPGHGTLSGTAPNLTYTPAADYNGPDAFLFKVTDTHGIDSGVATVSITVTPVNDPPVATDDAVTTPEDTPATVAVLANDTDADGDALSVTSVTPPAHGAATINADGTVTYAPAADYNGPDTFTYTISDGHGGAAMATVNMTVTPVNDAPVAIGQSVSTPYQTPVAVTPTGTDVDGDSLTFRVTSGPSHGSLSATSGAVGTAITYTPAAGYSGPDSFSFVVNDGSLDSSVAIISLTVETKLNQAPAAMNQSVSTNQDTPVTFPLNASDPDGDALTASTVSGPAHGAVTYSGLQATYTPAAGYAGGDSFTYKVNDGKVDSNTATVAITVNAVNHAPVATSQSVSVPYQTATPITLTGSDPDGDALTFRVTAGPSHGSLSGTAPNLTYTPAAGYSGLDSFSFVANDGTVDSTPATVSITVGTDPNHPPTATNQSVSTAYQTPVTFPLNASDPDGDALTTSTVSGPAHGAVTYSGLQATYTPNTGYSGPDSLTYKVNDGRGGTASATVSITVGAKGNGPPVANNQSVITNEDTAKAITLTASDPDGDPLTYTVVSGPGHGTLSGTAPNLTYTPAADYNGGDSFTFKVNDGKVDSNTATVAITVNPVNDPPVAVNDTATVKKNASVTIPVLANDRDPDGDALSVTSVGSSPNGTVVKNANGTVTCTPRNGYTGTITFTYTISDGHGGTATATVTLTVTK